MRRRRFGFWLGLAAALQSSSVLARGNRDINEWQRAVIDIGRSITDHDLSGSAWSVEYNSSFPSTDIGIALAPSSYARNASSLNVIAICKPAAGTVTVEGRDPAQFVSTRSLNFSVGANPPPDFVTGSIATASAALKVDSAKQITFSLLDVSVKQVSESDAIDAINAAECICRIHHRRDVFYVRGQYLMRLAMNQHRTGSGGVDLSLGLAATSPAPGFGVKWNRQLDWQITQTKPRPWFRIVSHFRRAKSNDVFELVQ